MAISQQYILDPVLVFLQANRLNRESSVVEVFQAVRKIPYGSGAGRTARSVVKRNKGSCSGKHMLLRDVLRYQGRTATIETIQGDFATGLPVIASMSDELKQMCRDGGITDYHHYVVLDEPDGEVMLDATWSDGPIAEGVSGNAGWIGVGHTKLALEPEVVMDRVEDVPDYKERLIANLPSDIQERRLTFLSLLSAWGEKTEAARR
jgi:hypothetical protein